MTTTRIYYEKLLQLFSDIAATKEADALKFLAIKAELKSLIERITMFNLFTLSFSENFLSLLSKTEVSAFSEEKILLLNEMNFELNECLDTTRLRYGGELLQYLYRIRLALFQLSIEELASLQKILKRANRGMGSTGISFDTEELKQEEITRLNKSLAEKPVKKRKIKLKAKDYANIQNQLSVHIGSYKSYIHEHYPSIADQFGYYQKRTRAYVTEGMSEKTYEFRVHAYHSEYADFTIKVEPQYYDFYPAYFDNLEETVEELSGVSVSGLSADTLKLESLFQPTHIHQELTSIFIKNGDDSEMVLFCEFLLKCRNYMVFPTHENQLFDLQAIYEGINYKIKVFHREHRDLETMLNLVKDIKDTHQQSQALFIFTTYPGASLLESLKAHGIENILLRDLYEPHFTVQNSILLHWYIKSRLPLVNPQSSPQQNSFGGEELIRQLERCKPGAHEWSLFESVGIKIFRFLFEDNFKIFLSETQVENDLKNHRRDLLVNNNPKDITSFWSEAKNQFNCSAIIIDFKNYSDPLKADEMFSVTKYMNDQVGSFAILFTRFGLDNGAILQQKSLLAQKKLVIDFSDQELIEMIREKLVGKDPIDRFESKKFQLIKGI